MIIAITLEECNNVLFYILRCDKNGDGKLSEEEVREVNTCKQIFLDFFPFLTLTFE